MTMHWIRSFVSRFMLVAGLAVMLAVGTAAASGPSEAAAMPNYTCTQAQNIALMYLSTANSMEALGYSSIAAFYYGKYEALADAFYPCGYWGGNGD